jgi:serpin B
MQKVVAGNTAFATDLYAKLKNQPGNLFFSPYSISTALAMTYAGARGETAQQMTNVLHFAVPQEKLHLAFASMQAELKAVQSTGKVQLNIANSLWPQKRYKFLPEYLALAKNHYDTTITPVDYERATEAARKTINDWVLQKTNGKITDLIGPGILNELTTLVLANAIYFKANWESQFDPKETTEQPFHVTASNEVKCLLMRHEHEYEYAETADLQILEIPYLNYVDPRTVKPGDPEPEQPPELSMIILLPKKMDGIVALENKLTSANLTQWARIFRPHVIVLLPKFKLTCEFSLQRTLAEMGMTDAFKLGKADFSGMDGSRDLFVSAVLHKAFVDVNEEGTEAAAATGVVMGRGRGDSQPPPPIMFRADHPFVFLIQEKQNGGILFMGRVTDPTK